MRHRTSTPACGTTGPPEAVDAAIAAAQRAAGIPIGGVDTGLGGLAPRDEDGGGGGSGTLPLLIGGATLLVLASFIAGRVRRRAARA